MNKSIERTQKQINKDRRRFLDMLGKAGVSGSILKASSIAGGLMASSFTEAHEYQHEYPRSTAEGDVIDLIDYMKWTKGKGLGVLTLQADAQYAFSEPLVMTDKVRHIVGPSLGSATHRGLPLLRYLGPDDSYAITAPGFNHGSLQGFTLYSRSAKDEETPMTTGEMRQNGVDFFRCSQSKIHDVHIKGFNVGIRTAHFWVADWSSLRLEENKTGWWHFYTGGWDENHSDCNAIFIKNLQALENDIGVLFDERANIRKVDITGNIEKNRVGVEFRNCKSIQNLKISAYWENNSESNVKSAPGGAMSSIWPRIDLSDSYFFSEKTQQVLEVDNTNAKEITEIILDRCNFIHAPTSEFLKISGPGEKLRLYSEDCTELGGGGPSSTSYERWKRFSKGPNVSTIEVTPLMDKFSGRVMRSVSRDGLRQLRGELELNSNASGTVEAVWDSGKGVFSGDFNSLSGEDTYHPVSINGKPQSDTFLRIQGVGDGALVSNSSLTLKAGDEVIFDVYSLRPPG